MANDEREWQLDGKSKEIDCPTLDYSNQKDPVLILPSDTVQQSKSQHPGLVIICLFLFFSHRLVVNDELAH